jgi:hypothetical protein
MFIWKGAVIGITKIGVFLASISVSARIWFLIAETPLKADTDSDTDPECPPGF